MSTYFFRFKYIEKRTKINILIISLIFLSDISLFSKSKSNWGISAMSRRFILKQFLILVILFISSENIVADHIEDTNNIFNMSLEELMNIEVASTATLTESKPRLVPATITTISEEEIKASNARSLFELLDIYVPNLQWIRHNWEMDHLGLRGIINDRDDKYLLLVNGRIMNDRTHAGAFSERDLMYMMDIHHIDIIRGPGSGLYGPGAVSMVINIVTHNAETFQGTEITSRLGAVEEFYSTEIRHGRKFNDDDGGLFLYSGIGKYSGASKYDATQISGLSYPEDATFPWNPSDPGSYLPGEGTNSGDPLVDVDIPRDGRSHRDLPPLKGYLELTRGNWDIWARYTRGGQQFILPESRMAHFPAGYADFAGFPLEQSSSGYQQATAYFGYNKELTDKLELDLAFSYDLMDFERIAGGDIFDAYREDEYFGKTMLKYNPNNKHKFALGFEISHEEFGFSSPGWPHEENAVSFRFSQAGLDFNRWSTNLYSIVGEHQWTINDQWTSFIGARVDEHTYTDGMFSPRIALVHTPNDKDTYKFLWSKSIRSNNAEEMRIQAISSGGDSHPEKLDSAEIRYERKHNKKLDLAASGFFHYNLDLIGWSDPDLETDNIGTQKEWGIELEASYHNKKSRISISHGYTKLYDFDLKEGKSTYITSEPFGYGDDFANWSNHITKINAEHKLNDKWTVNGSLRAYWRFSGMRDYEKYKNDTGTFSTADSGWEASYRGNFYLNTGLQYIPSRLYPLIFDVIFSLGLY